MEYEDKCKKCKKKETAYGSDYCYECKEKRANKFFFIAFPIIILIILVGGVGGFVQYNYEKQKCLDLNSDESNYDFDKTIEVNANYNERCYFINNHPFALIGNIAAGCAPGLTFLIFLIIFRLANVEI